MKLTPLLAIALLAGLAGCASSADKLPGVKYRDGREAMEIVAARADAVKTVSAEGLMTFRRPDGQSVRFDVAMVRDNAGRLRLRAWKLGRAVFDLTINCDGVWLLTPDDPALKQKVRSAGINARQLAETWNLFTRGDLFRSPQRHVYRFDGTWMCEVPHGDTTVNCAVNGHSLVPFRFWLLDAQRRERFSLDLDAYHMIGNLPFPFRCTATSADGEILISFTEIELNEALAEGAFVPPRRAEKLP